MVSLGVYLTGTSDVGGANGGIVRSATITAAAATSTLVLRRDGSGGTVILTLSVVANTSFQWRGATGYSGQLHATLSGASATAQVEVE